MQIGYKDPSRKPPATEHQAGPITHTKHGHPSDHTILKQATGHNSPLWDVSVPKS